MLFAAILYASDVVTFPNNLHLAEVFLPERLDVKTARDVGSTGVMFCQNKVLVREVASQSPFTNCFCGDFKIHHWEMFVWCRLLLCRSCTSSHFTSSPLMMRTSDEQAMLWYQFHQLCSQKLEDVPLAALLSV